MSTRENTATEWIFRARSLARTANGHEQALRCMARAGLRAASVYDWIATAAAWGADFEDPDMARECLGKAELVAEETGEGWDEIIGAWVGMKDFQRVVEICREVHQPRPWPRIAEIQNQGPFPLGTSVLDWIEPGESALASRQAVGAADSAMEGRDTLEAIKYLIDADSMAESTADYIRIAGRWRQWFPELGEFERMMARVEEVVDTPEEWVRIALKWKIDFQDYDKAVACLLAAEQCGGSGIDSWECILATWKDDFSDPDNFRSALTGAYGEEIPFDRLTSMVVENLGAYELIEKASLVDLGTLSDRTVSRVAAWDDGFRSERGERNLAGYYRFNLPQSGDITVFLKSDVDNYLYLIQGKEPSGEVILMDQDEGYDEALSMIKLHLDAGTYVVEAATEQTPDSNDVRGYGIFHLQIYVGG